MLDRSSRAIIIGAATVCLIGAIALAPGTAFPTFDSVAPVESVPAASAWPQSSAGPIDVRRDPFAGEPSAAAPAVAPAPLQGAVPAAAAAHDLPALPANLAAGEIPAIPGDAQPTGTPPRVTAIVTGSHPYAMLDFGGNHQIKGIGDRVAGAPIVAIDISGVTLQGGRRLTVAPEEFSR